MDLRKAAAGRIGGAVVKPGKLVDLLDEIQSAPDPPSDLLERFGRAYAELSRSERSAFFTMLAGRLEVPKTAVEAELRAALASRAEDPAEWSTRMTRLRRGLESPRMRAFRRFMNASGGLKFLLELRADVLAAERQEGLELGPLDEEIAHLFESWFHLGFLFLKEITQESPYRQIRFLKEHDLVHPMTSLEEMGNRLGEDRRCFALYHRAMPEEPVLFIEVALTRRIPSSIHEILDGRAESSVADPDTAVFYSINNTQQGLSGLGLGKLLVFQVVDAIKKDRPRIRTFATLSPVPGFRSRYLEPLLDGDDTGFAWTREDLLGQFSSSARQKILERAGARDGELGAVLREILASPSWADDPVYAAELRRPLTQIAFHYLTEEKDASGKPLNPVAGFHLGNGARLTARNVHFGANRTERAILDACGVMVSYVYSSSWLHELRRTARSVLPWQG